MTSQAPGHLRWHFRRDHYINTFSDVLLIQNIIRKTVDQIVLFKVTHAEEIRGTVIYLGSYGVRGTR